MGINADGTLGLSTWSSISDNPPTDGSFPTSNMTIPLSTWTEIAFTWSPQGSYAYINGVQDGYSPLDFYPALNPTDYVYLNCWGGSAPIQMDELRISDVARTQFNVATTPKLVAANASTLTISGYGFDATTANDSVTFDHGVTGTVTSASLTSLTVSVSGLSSLIAGTALDASVTVDGVSSGSLVQVTTISPVVTSSTANVAANATSMIISGYGFDTTTANDSVTFNNGVTGTVTSASLTSLTVTVNGPSSLTAGTALDASVTVDGLSSGSLVQVATIAPVVTPSTAALATNATSLTISGYGFDTNPGKDSVTFNNGATGTVTSASLTSLTVRVSGLTNLTSGTALEASVTVDGVSSATPVPVATVLSLSVSAELNATTFSGSNQVSTQATYQSAQGDNFVSVNTSQTYQLSGWACSGNGQGGAYDPANRQYFGFACYDSDKNPIEPYDVAKVAGATDTTLAQELKPGATTIVLTNANGWYSGSTSYERSLAWYGYKNSSGYVYPNYTYTRNVLQNAWNQGGITGNVITLSTPWAGPDLPAGTAVRNATSGASYNYAALYSGAVSAAWTQYTAAISGVEQNGALTPGVFWPGTTYIKPVILFNNQSQADNLVTWRDVSWAYTSPAVFQSGDTVALHVGGVTAGTALTYSWTQLSGLMVCLQNAQTATASFVVPPATSGFLTFQVTVSNGTTILQQTVAIDVALSASAALNATTFSGSNQVSTQATYQSAQGDNFVPVNTNQTYQLSGVACSGNGQGGNYDSANRQYFGFACYDSDKLEIEPYDVAKVAGAADTTLAQELKPGATTIVLTNTGGWYSGSTSYERSLAWYGYMNSSGYVYPNYTYTRNVLQNAWNQGGISGNVITLSAPWAGPDLPAGTAVRNATSGASYNYAALYFGAVPASWTQYAATISGVEQNGALTPGVFWPGTAYIKPVIMFNNQSQADNLVTWRDVSWTYASLTPFHAGDTVTLHLGGVTAGTALTYSWTQLSGPTVILQNAQTATASFVVPPSTGGTLTFQVTVSNGSTTLQQTVSVSVVPLSVSAVLDATTFSGSNQVSTEATYQSVQGDTFVPVNTSQTYQLSGSACSGDGQGNLYDSANRQYFGIACYDSDKKPIEPYDVAKVPGATDTTLAQELKPGATTIVLTNAGGWYSGSTSYERSLAWYGYANSSGYVYPNYTYTRNVLQNAWNQGGITGNVITLSTPWAGPDLPVGTAVRNATSGSSYNYAALDFGAVPATWTQYTATISGVEQNGALTPGVFWPGTAYIKPVILFNNQTQADNLVTWRDVSWTYVSPATFQTGDTVALHVGGVVIPGTALTYSWTQLSGPTVSLQNAQTATASFMVPPSTSGTLAFQVTVGNGSTLFQQTISVSVALTVSADLNATTFSGSNQVSTEATYQSVQGDTFVPVSTSQIYQLSGWAYSGNGQGGAYDPANRQYFGFACYDSDKLEIEPYDVAKVAGAADTTLAQELKPGATTIVLTNAGGWYSGNTSYERSLAWYGYANSSGYVYPNYTYTRNVLQNAWNQGGISGNVITLSTPWAGPDLPAGTAVRNATSGASYNYAVLYGGAVPAAWTLYTATISGVEQNGGLTPGVFWPGTAYIKPLILFNNQSQADNLVTWQDVSWTYASPATFQKGDEVALHVGGVAPEQR